MEDPDRSCKITVPHIPKTSSAPYTFLEPVSVQPVHYNPPFIMKIFSALEFSYPLKITPPPQLKMVPEPLM